MQERDYRENQHPPYCTCVDCSMGLNKSKKSVEPKNISKIFKKHKKSKKKNKKEKLPEGLDQSVFDSIAYKYPSYKPSENPQKVTVSRKKSVSKKKVKSEWSPEPKKKTNKKPKYNPNKKSNKPQFKGNNPNNIKPKEKSLLRKILGLGIF